MITAEIAKHNVLNFKKQSVPTKYDKQALNIIFDITNALEELGFNCKVVQVLQKIPLCNCPLVSFLAPDRFSKI